MKNAINIFLSCVLLLLSGVTNAAIPFPMPEGYFVKAKMPMHLVYPRADTETQAHARHRWAHPDMSYEIPLGVQGGAWPFKYELIKAPAGAKIGSLYGDPNYGAVTWTPAAATGVEEFVVRITDQELNTVEARWKVTIDPGMFVFIKAGATGPKAGTIASPLANVIDWYKDAEDSTFLNKIIVFRAGSYNLIGDAVNNGNLRLHDKYKTPSLIGFPGEAAIIDASTAKIMVGDLTDIFIADLTWKNARNDVANAHYFWLTGDVSRATFWRNQFTEMRYGTVGTDNTGPVFISNTVKMKNYILFKENIMSGINNDAGNGHYFDVYKTSYVLVEQNVAKNSRTSYGFWLKESIAFVTVRANEAIDNVKGTQLTFGYGSSELPHDHEACWNRIMVPENQDGPALKIADSDINKGKSYNTFIYRNTIVNGYSIIRFAGKELYETDANVIVTKKPALWSLAEMKTATPNIVAGPTSGIISSIGTRLIGGDFGKVGADVAVTPAPIAPLNPKYQ